MHRSSVRGGHSCRVFLTGKDYPELLPLVQFEVDTRLQPHSWDSRLPMRDSDEQFAFFKLNSAAVALKNVTDTTGGSQAEILTV